MQYEDLLELQGTGNWLEISTQRLENNKSERFKMNIFSLFLFKIFFNAVKVT